MAVSERTPCEPGTCWAESLGEACDHWKAEADRLRVLVDDARDMIPHADVSSRERREWLESYATLRGGAA